MVGIWNGQRFVLEELHRFSNGGVSVRGAIEWDVLRLWTEILSGLRKFRAKYDESPAGIAVDAWGVDFGLLDKDGRRLEIQRAIAIREPMACSQRYLQKRKSSRALTESAVGADAVLVAKAAMMAELGIEVHLCGN